MSHKVVAQNTASLDDWMQEASVSYKGPTSFAETPKQKTGREGLGIEKEEEKEDTFANRVVSGVKKRKVEATTIRQEDQEESKLASMLKSTKPSPWKLEIKAKPPKRQQQQLKKQRTQQEEQKNNSTNGNTNEKEPNTTNNNENKTKKKKKNKSKENSSSGGGEGNQAKQHNNLKEVKIEEREEALKPSGNETSSNTKNKAQVHIKKEIKTEKEESAGEFEESEKSVNAQQPTTTNPEKKKKKNKNKNKNKNKKKKQQQE